MLAVWAMTNLPAFRNGGANGARLAERLSRTFDIAAIPPGRRATST
jgi:hypothetical protein